MEVPLANLEDLAHKAQYLYKHNMCGVNDMTMQGKVEGK